MPYAGEGGPDKLDTIEGRVIGARPGQRIVLYARYGPWWVQPRVDQPFTEIQSDATWRNLTHFGTEYAALLVDSSFHPQPTMDTFQGQSGVLVVAIAKGRPPFWLTWWFVVAAASLMLVLMLLLLRLRTAAITRQMNMRFEERLAERARIARELHDSLLQGFQGLMFHLQAARELLPDRPQEAMHALEAVLDRGDQALAEGRNTLENLRSTMFTGDLSQAIAALGQELNTASDGLRPTFRVLVEGKRRHLEPLLRDEVYRIAREALRNAFTHSQARQIEAQITYADSRFLLRVRDDGIGLDSGVFQRGGKPGHWGLPGMRERASEFGGSLKVWSERQAGTEVELSVPASVLYAHPSNPHRFLFLRKNHSENHDRQS